MTLEELFAEEYKSLKKENEELKKHIERLRRNLDLETKENTEFCSFLSSLKLRINTNYDEKKYIEITNIVTTISEDNKFYDLISEFAKEEDESKGEDEKCQSKN